MEAGRSRLTVFFESPFWVAVYEREWGGSYQAAKVTFGAEPRDGEVYDFFLRTYRHLEFSPALPGRIPAEGGGNPKRLQREIRKQIGQSGVGTKAQQALKLQQEQGRQARKERTRAQREEAERLRYEQRRLKQKEKHRGH